MKSKKLKIIIASLAVVLLAGGAATLAFLTDTTDLLTNVFQKGKKYTLTYHANTGSLIDDTKVNNLPEKQTEYGNKKDPVSFTVSSEVPTRPGMVFVKWTEGEAENTTTHDGGSTWTVPLEQYESDLYAQWTAGYTLIYDPNGGSGTPAITAAGDEKVNGNVVTTVTDANTYTFSKLATQGEMKGPEHKDSSDPEKTSTANRVFLGWSTDKGATEPEYTSDGKLAYDNTEGDYDGTKIDDFSKELEIKAAENPDKTVTLYAVWATKYELRFSYHPEMLAMTKPKCGTEKPDTMTLVSSVKKAHTFELPSPAEAEAENIVPTRSENYRWGWWGDNLERFKFKEPGSGQTAAQAGNEGCYQFGEPVPARSLGDTSKAPNYSDPVLTLYAYFQPPAACSITFDDNSRIPTAWDSEGEPTKYKQNPKYPDLEYKDENGDNRNDNVENMPDNAGASTTEQEWEKTIPGGDANTPKHQKWNFIGWSEDRDASEAQYQPGEKIKVNKVLNNKITLYAIWEPMHKFRLTFNRGYKNSKGNIEYTGTNEYYVQTSSRQWKRGGYNIWFDSNATEYEIDSGKYFTETSFTWPAGFFKKRGFFATKDDDPVGTYKFLGWSWTPQELSTDEEYLMSQVAFPVEIPDDPSTILNKAPDDSDIGIVKEAVTVTEKTPCTKPTTHGESSSDADGYTLYAVYRKSPLHQLRVVFDKGSATEIDYKGTKDGNNDVHLIKIDGVTQGLNRYYASIDYPTYTWNTEYWKTHTPTATKEDKKDETATYTFLGWSTNEEHKTPSPTITKADIDYPLDENNNITKPITVNEEADEAKDCKGGVHKITLYPVFRENPFHVYKLKYDVNAPSSADGIVTKFYKNLTDAWNMVQIFPDPNNMVPKPDPMPEKGDAVGELYSEVEALDVKSKEWDMSGKGLFVTCDNTGKIPTGEYTFLGWTTGYKFKVGEFDPNDPTKKPDGTKDPSIKYYPVTAPDDPENPSGAGVFGNDAKIKIDVDEQNPKPADACGNNEGKTHTETLYGVWAGEPIHQYSVIFAGNSSKSSEDDVTILYGTDAEWQSNDESKLKTSKETISKTYKRDNETIKVKYYDADSDSEIELAKDIKNTYRVYSEALPLPKTPAGDRTDSYTFRSNFWNDDTDPENVKDLIVKAKRNPSDGIRYVFDGWNTKADGTGTNVTVDNKGYITSNLTVKDKGYGHTDGETGQYVVDCDSLTHNIILYAKWKEVKIHNFQLIFSNIDAKELGYMDNGTWKRGTNTTTYKSNIQNSLVDPNQASFIPYSFYGDAKVTKKLDVDAKTSYSWGETGDSGEKLRVMAAKDGDTNYRYVFVGWSKTKKEPSETYTSNDVDYAVDKDGYIQKDIEIADPDIDASDPESKCTKPTHTLVLYPVFKKVPIHNFSVTFDLRGGDYLRTLNSAGTAWTTTGTKTYYQPEDGKKVDVEVAVRSKEWTYDSFWKTRGFGARWDGDDTDNTYTYEFAGWTTDPDSKTFVDEGATPNVTWESAGTDYVGDGFIKDTIKAVCSNDPCDGGTHNVNLHAIWKRTPRAKTYTLKFDANGGENPPAAITKTKAYDASDADAWNSESFELKNQQILDSGMKNGKKVFVGWHEDKGADNGKFGEKNTSNAELEQLTQGLSNPYKISNTKMSTTLSDYITERTLYAIWWYEYQLDYHANGGSGAPEHDHAYTSDNYYSFKIADESQIPTHADNYRFLGWSKTQTTPGAGTEADVDFVPSKPGAEVRYVVNAEEDAEGEVGYTAKKLYAVWGPAN